jgi:hypothetical protein
MERSVNSQIIENLSEIYEKPLISASCTNCGRSILFDPSNTLTVCPICRLGELNEHPIFHRDTPPETIIPFEITDALLQEQLNNFIAPVRFRTPDLKSDTLTANLKWIFLPMWLVDTNITGNWSALAGFDYQVKSSQEKFINGQWQSEEILETKSKWADRQGTIERRYDNVAIPALNNYNLLIESIGKFDFKKAKPYNPEFITNSIITPPNLDPDEIWDAAENRFIKAASIDCMRAAGAQYIDKFELTAEYKNQNWTQLLLPVGITSYVDDQGTPQSIVINGQTGKIFGRRSASQKKGNRLAAISFSIALLAFLISLIFMAMVDNGTPLFNLASLFIFCAFCISILSLVPLIWPWLWNRKQQKIIEIFNKAKTPLM